MPIGSNPVHSAACPGRTSWLHVLAARTGCMSWLHVLAARTGCTSWLQVLAACPGCTTCSHSLSLTWVFSSMPGTTEFSISTSHTSLTPVLAVCLLGGWGMTGIPLVTRMVGRFTVASTYSCSLFPSLTANLLHDQGAQAIAVAVGENHSLTHLQ